MSEYEVTFVVEPMDEQTEEAVLTSFDCVIGENHGGQHYITLTTEGADAADAIKHAAFALRFERHVTIRRADYDLASRTELAYRLDKTPQAVGLWIRGERHAGHPFPERFSDVAGGIWLWGDVVSWVREVLHEDPADGLAFPTREDIESANEALRREFAEIPEGVQFMVRRSQRRGGSVAEIVGGTFATGPISIYWAGIGEHLQRATEITEHQIRKDHRV